MLTIGDIAKVFDGPHATPKKIESGPYFLSISSLENGKLDLSKSAHLSDEDFAKWTRRVTPEAGDILFSYETRLGEVAMMPSGITACLGRRMGLLRPDRKKILPEYLLYAYQSNAFQEIIRAKTIHGATVDRIALKELPSFPIQVPTLIEQQMIVDILRGYDRKLILNSELNQTLEEMAQAIFKSWFVDFDPVKAKMNGEQPEGIDVSTASLFPEKLVESELGLIPEGWELKTLKSLSEKISKGTTPSKMDLESATDEPSIRFIKVRDINEQGEILRGKLEIIPDSIHTTKLKRSILKKEDILFSIAGTIGRVAIVDQDLDNVNTNQAVAFVRLKEKQTYLPLVYMALRENRLQQKAIASIVQGVQANLSLANVGDMEVIVPSEDILNLWNKQYSSILQMIKNNFAQSRELTSLRNTLLPKLLSGEIDLDSVNDASEVN